MSRVEEIEVRGSSQIVTLPAPVQPTATATPILQTLSPAPLAPAPEFLHEARAEADRQAVTPTPGTAEGWVISDNDPGDDDDDTSPPPQPEEPEEPEGETGVPTGTAIDLDTRQGVEVVAGRVTTLLPEDDHGRVASVRILEDADWGHVSVNPDNSLALVLSDTDQTGTLSFRYEVTYADGRSENATATVKVVAGPQQAGWGLGDHYMLETDAEGRSIVEHGANHREVYVSADRDALSFQDIARIEGVKASAIDGRWLAEHAEYGSSAEMALDEAAGSALWGTLTGRKADPSSHWLLLESGHTYDEMGFLVLRGTRGESALNPVLIGAYGEGERPIVANTQIYNTPENENIVMRGLAFTDGLKILQGRNYLLEDLGIRHETLTAQDVDGFTLRNSDIIDVYRTEPNSPDFWQPHINRLSGFYANGVEGLLVENNFVDHTGWADNYKADLSLSGGQPPSIYSQGLYLSYDNSDLTLRDNILMRNASFGAQVRSGGVIENNLFLDNNAGVNFLGGDDEKTHGNGNYTLLLDNVITSGAHRDVTEGPRGALTMGADNSGRMSTMIDNIIAHLADPNNPAELAKKYVGHPALSEKFAPFYNDTLIYNWFGGRHIERNLPVEEVIGNLDRTVLNETTIQKFTAELLGKPTASIADLADYLRDQAAGKLEGEVDSAVINAFFREGFGLDTTLRDAAETLRFIPNDLADGIRWDNRLNWSTGDLPGTREGDSVDLGGNHVRFGGQTLTVDHFDFGSGGKLTATSGKLTIAGETGAAGRGAVLETDATGQVWIDGYRDETPLDINIAGGRFANTGVLSGLRNLTVSDDGQAILASTGGRLVMGSESQLTLTGSKARAGFDGGHDGTAVLALKQGASLNFIADAAGLSGISEFRLGAFDSDAVIRSGIALDGRLTIDLADLGNLDPRQDTRWTLLQANEIIGNFDGVRIDGLGLRRDALLRIDYDSDTVVLALSAEGRGSGRVRMIAEGDEDFQIRGDAATDHLWNEMHATF